MKYTLLFKKITASILAIFITFTMSEWVLCLLYPQDFEIYPSENIQKINTYSKNSKLYDDWYGELCYYSDNFNSQKIIQETRTDAYGYTIPKEYNKEFNTNIIVIGDSYSVSSKFSNGYSWVDQLSSINNNNVYNLSVAGASPYQELIALKKYIETHGVTKKTKIIWPIFEGNDLDDTYYKSLSLESLRSSQFSSILQYVNNFFQQRRLSKFIKNFYYKMKAIERKSLVKIIKVGNRDEMFFKPYLERSIRSKKDIEFHPNYELLKQTFVEMKNVTSKYDLDLLCVYFPSKEHTYLKVLHETEKDGFEQAIKLLSNSNGFKFYSFSKCFLEEISKNKKVWFQSDTHLSVFGHNLVVDKIHF